MSDVLEKKNTYGLQRRRKQFKSDQAMGVVYNGRGIEIKLFIDYD